MKDSRLDKIRADMKRDFMTGGKRAQFAWLYHWFSLGNGIIGYIKYIVVFMGLVVSLTVEFMAVVAMAYIVASLVIGVAWDWFNMSSLSATVGNILNRDMFDRIEDRITKDSNGNK